MNNKQARYKEDDILLVMVQVAYSEQDGGDDFEDGHWYDCLLLNTDGSEDGQGVAIDTKQVVRKLSAADVKKLQDKGKKEELAQVNKRIAELQKQAKALEAALKPVVAKKSGK